MAGAARDRITIDLRGIGDRLRSAASSRQQTVAAFVRAALETATDPQPLGSDRNDAASRGTLKLTLRLREIEAERLIANARLLGLSYGEYVGRLVGGTPLPAPIAQHNADRAALRVSSDNLAVLAGDINAVIRLLTTGRASEAARDYGQRLRGLESDVRRHIELASRLIAGASR